MSNWHDWTPRTWAALTFAVISVGASLVSGALYSQSQHALHEALSAQAKGRVLRKLTDLHFCRAINQGRRINNRDRETFIHARASTLDDLKTVKDPVLSSLLRKSLASTSAELRARPFLKPLPCVREIQHPAGSLPPSITTATTTGASP